MGPVPISWTEIDAWSRQTGVALTPWEARVLRDMSQEFAEWLDKGKNPNQAAPWDGPTDAEDP